MLFDNAAVVNVVKFLSLIFVINSLAFLPSVLLTRELEYKKLFSPQVGSAVVNYTLSIITGMERIRLLEHRSS